MGMKRATVQFQIEAALEIEVPMGATLAEVEKLAHAAVKKEAGTLSSDLSGWEVTWIEEDQG
jgi:hypothetical protein